MSLQHTTLAVGVEEDDVYNANYQDISSIFELGRKKPDEVPEMHRITTNARKKLALR